MTILTVKLAIQLYKHFYRDPSNRDQITEDQLRPSLQMASGIARQQG